MRKPSFPPARKIYKVQMYGINRYRDGSARINACGDSRLRGHRSRKPIGFRQWVVHLTGKIIVLGVIVNIVTGIILVYGISRRTNSMTM